MVLKEWKILKKNKELVWFQNKKDKSKLVEISTGTIQTGNKFQPYERVWKVHIPNRMAGKSFQSKPQALNYAKNYMTKHKQKNKHNIY